MQVSTSTGFWYDASYEPLEVFVISIWFVQSFVEFKVIAGRQILVIYIPGVYSNKTLEAIYLVYTM